MAFIKHLRARVISDILPKMAKRSSNLSLYLAIACFLGIVAVFLVDGYMGIYDTIWVTAGEHTQKIDSEYWERGGKEHAFPIGVTGGEVVSFRYQVDNRRPSSYSLDINASLWKSNQKIRELLISSDDKVRPFSHSRIYEWTLDTAGLELEEYTVKIKRDGVERRVVLGLRSPSPRVYPVYPP
jgi:hypothetical protein